LPAAHAQGPIDFAAARRKLIEQEIVGAGITDPRVIEAMRSTPRHEFVPVAERARAYLDMSLPIGDQQTISSPFIVAFMTESLEPQPGDKVLEIGTGSGYQAAVLSPLVKEVYTIEIVETLGRRAARTLTRLGYKNVFVRVGDGFLGWPEHAPFDKIIVTCSPEQVPQPLVEQLKEGGRMVIPVGERYQQTLYLLKKVDGQLVSEKLRPTLFVPMTGHAEKGRVVQPDPRNPSLVNGNFEADGDQPETLPGWYYQRLVVRYRDPTAPEGEHVARLENDQPGQASRLMQGLGLDGRAVGSVKLSAWVKPGNIAPGPQRDMQASIVLSLYDDQRRDLGQWWLGPWRGTLPWHHASRTIRIPPQAREAIVRVGLFGATGQLLVDDLRLEPLPR
jgi:protein-L-isoaspartate(D-aspartate) O-methyltransferase